MGPSTPLFNRREKPPPPPAEPHAGEEHEEPEQDHAASGRGRHGRVGAPVFGSDDIATGVPLPHRSREPRRPGGSVLAGKFGTTAFRAARLRPENVARHVLAIAMSMTVRSASNFGRLDRLGERSKRAISGSRA